MFNRYCTKCDEVVANKPYRNETNCDKCVTKFLLQCSKCNRRFDHYRKIAYHLKYDGGCGQEPNIYCNLCAYKTKNRTRLETHLRSHESSNKTIKTDDSLIDEGPIESTYMLHRPCNLLVKNVDFNFKPSIIRVKINNYKFIENESVPVT